MAEPLKKVLMERDGISQEEANKLIACARAEMHDLLLEGNMEEAEEICYNHFDLEPDYLMDLM